MIVSKLRRLTSLVVALLMCSSLVTKAGGLFPRLEASFAITNLTSDPFDYSVTDVKVQVLQPDGTSLSLPAFFDGGQTWRVRHAPSLRGLYQISGVTLNSQP